MYGHNLVAVYPTHQDAERVKGKLIAAGVAAASIRISDEANTPTAPSSVGEREEPGFFAWLFGDAPEDDRACYDTHLRQNRAILSVHAEDQDCHLRALDIMEEARPIRLDDQARVSGMSGREGAIGASDQSANRPSAGARMAQASTQSRGQEQVIPVVKEELSVGKQATERHTRVRVYTVSRPVEKEVTLRDERVTIERWPATGTAAAGTPQDRTIDVIERHETPVAEKHGRVAEEIVVRKEVTERPESVRGTVQETKVEVEKERAGGPPPRKP
jgi:stress response protein YsnF